LNITDRISKKLVPVIVTGVPTFPEVGVKLVRVGALGTTVSTLLSEVKPGAEAVMFTVPGESATTATGTATAPEGMVTEAVSVAMLGLALSRLMVTPPVGAGNGSWTVRDVLCPTARLRVSGIKLRGPPKTVKLLVKGTRGLPLVSLMSEVSWTV
jgi:hypothetical protein